MEEIQRIGENAGKIWHVLNERKELPAMELSRCIGASYDDTIMAVGWLARENKVCLYRRNGELFVSNMIRYEFSFG